MIRINMSIFNLSKKKSNKINTIMPLNADKKAYKLDPIERSKLSFDRLALSITRLENGEKLLSQNQLEKLGFRCEPFWDTANDIEGDCYKQYIKAHPDFSLSIRSEVANRLIKAQNNLPSNWKIVLKAGFRPLSVQSELFQAIVNISKKTNPSFNDKQHIKYARIYVTDPSTKYCPSHITGGAVDIDIFDSSTKQFVDMGCLPNTNGEIASLHSNKVGLNQYNNRLTLLRAMLDAEFAPLANEWWHYQYGETYWAAFYGYKTTKYNLITV
ncbi:MAG: zinc D-Ala-D-Ala dipeptidase [Patescibacteria group bacterium]|nr:zinc D-Ala-D-Ala dipeptidase [Patescibacteria group bacterium]